ncbi:MAG: LicD family protein [Dehalococcoidia bacterium]|nr:LicD family protein [Dehalococcoidia bacterium]
MSQGRTQIDNSLEPIQAAGPFSERDIYLLREVVRILDELGITFWLDQGALLGIFRDGRFIPWDADIDLSVWDEDVRKVEPLLRKRLSSLEKARVDSFFYVFRVYSAPPHQHLPVSIHRHFRRGREAVKQMKRAPDARSFRGLAYRVVLLLGRLMVIRPGERALGYGVQIDASRPGGLVSRITGIVGRVLLWFRDSIGIRLGEYLQVTCEMSVDAGYFERLRPVILGDLRLAAPADTEAYLELKYGKDWRTPRQEWKYWEEDGAVTQG